jgi:polyisoprenoid-binding protein YceI
MALRQVAIGISPGNRAESTNVRATLTTTLTTAIGAVGTANAVAGSNADVTTELAAVTAAVTALTANDATGPMVVTIDTAVVTTKNRLLDMLNAAFVHLGQQLP